MRRRSTWRTSLAIVAVGAIAALTFAIAGCGGDGDDEVATAPQIGTAESTATTAVTAAATATAAPAGTVAATPAPTETAPPAAATEVRRLRAGVATITLDGQMDDWAAIEGIEVPLTKIPDEFNEDESFGQDVTATLKVATDDTHIYVLLAVPDGYDYDPENHRLSPALGVEWLIDEGADAAMGALEPDYEESGGMVDIWHWELDCGPGELSGGVFVSGNDPDCNLDDEYATLTDEREDDDAENSLTGSWDHTARAQGIGAAGTFVFEMARPLVTDDPQDAQFAVGSTAKVAIAYWDGNEGREKDGGWSDAGHVQSALEGWIEVVLPQ